VRYSILLFVGRRNAPVEPEKTPRKRASKFIKDVVAPAWQPSRDQVLWATRIVLVLVVLLSIITLIGLPFHVTLWDWLDLLIIPVVLAIGGFLFTRSENRATQAAAERRTLDDTLQAYLDGMSQLLTDKDQPLHRAQLGDSLSTVARARTLTVLTRLDGGRKASVVRFLYESGLITKDHRILDLRQADLSSAALSRASLSGADLSGTHLYEANLRDANLSGADLSGTHEYGTNLTNEKLEERQAASLEGATMPNGQKYEDWIKDREGRKENGKSGGSS
jgi:preprotein translocase subunit SecE